MSELRLSRIAQSSRDMFKATRGPLPLAPYIPGAGIFVALSVCLLSHLGYTGEGYRAVREFSDGNILEGIRSSALAENLAILSYFGARAAGEILKGISVSNPHAADRRNIISR